MLGSMDGNRDENSNSVAWLVAGMDAAMAIPADDFSRWPGVVVMLPGGSRVAVVDSVTADGRLSVQPGDVKEGNFSSSGEKHEVFDGSMLALYRYGQLQCGGMPHYCMGRVMTW